METGTRSDPDTSFGSSAAQPTEESTTAGLDLPGESALMNPDTQVPTEMVSNTVLMREDSVALAHRRLGNGLSGSMDSMPLSRDRLGTGVPPDAVPPAERGSSGIRSRFRSLSATIKSILPGDRRRSLDSSTSAAPPQISKVSGRVHFAAADSLGESV